MFTGFTTIIVPNGVRSLERSLEDTKTSNYFIAQSFNEAYEKLLIVPRDIIKTVRIGIPVSNIASAIEFTYNIRLNMWNVNIDVVCNNHSEETIEKLRKLKVNHLIVKKSLALV